MMRRKGNTEEIRADINMLFHTHYASMYWLAYALLFPKVMMTSRLGRSM